MAHARQLTKLLNEPDAQRMWNRPFRILSGWDTPDGAGYSVLGDLYFIDPVLEDAIRTGHLRVHGLDNEQLINCLIRHERIEKTLLDADNNIAFYPAAHEFATCGEHELVRFYRARPVLYEHDLRPILRICERKPIRKPHPQLDSAPYVDDPDREERDHIIPGLQRCGVLDAKKEARHKVKYRPGDDKGKCWACKHYQPTDEIRGMCEGVEGLVLGRMMCDNFAAKQALAGASPPGLQTPAAGPAPTALAAQPQAAAPAPIQASPTKQSAPAAGASPAPTSEPTPGSPPPTPAAPPQQPPPQAPAPAPQPPTQPQPPTPLPPRPPRPPVPMPVPQPPEQLPAAARGTDPVLTKLMQDSAAAQNNMAQAIKDLAASLIQKSARDQEIPPINVNIEMPKSRPKRIETRRDRQGNLVAHVHEADED